MASVIGAGPYVEEDPSRYTIAEAPVTEDGSFELALPAKVPDELLDDIGNSFACPEGGDVTITPEGVLGTSVILLNLSQDGTHAGFAMQATSRAVVEGGPDEQGSQFVDRLYSTGPVFIQGTRTFEADATVTFNLDLQEGWNTTLGTVTAVSEGIGSTERTVADVLDGLRWFFVPHEDTGSGETGGGNTGGETGGGETGGVNAPVSPRATREVAH